MSAVPIVSENVAGRTRATRLPVTICILTFNRCALVEKLLNEVTALTYKPLEILVVDNHSEDGTEQMVRSSFPDITYFRTERNIGAAGRNIGMKAARGEVVVTLDDDVSGLSDQDLETLVAVFVNNPTIGAVNFQVTNDSGQVCNWVHHCKMEEFRSKSFLTYEITEGAVAFRKTALALSGCYPDGFFLSHEGVDLAFRIIESGYSVTYTGRVTVRHSFAPQGRQPWRNYYYDTRNQFWLAARNFPCSYAAMYLARGLGSTLVYSLRDGYTRYWLKALRDGIVGLKDAVRHRKVLSRSTMRIVQQIDSQRPGLAYMMKKRLLSNDTQMWK